MHVPEVIHGAQQPLQVRARELRAQRPAVQAHHEALPYQRVRSPGAQPHAGQPAVDGDAYDSLLRAILERFKSLLHTFHEQDMNLQDRKTSDSWVVPSCTVRHD